jgi:hypothetical protein
MLQDIPERNYMGAWPTLGYIFKHKCVAISKLAKDRYLRRILERGYTANLAGKICNITRFDFLELLAYSLSLAGYQVFIVLTRPSTT